MKKLQQITYLCKSLDLYKFATYGQFPRPKNNSWKYVLLSQKNIFYLKTLCVFMTSSIFPRIHSIRRVSMSSVSSFAKYAKEIKDDLFAGSQQETGEGSQQLLQKNSPEPKKRIRGMKKNSDQPEEGNAQAAAENAPKKI